MLSWFVPFSGLGQAIGAAKVQRHATGVGRDCPCPNDPSVLWMAAFAIWVLAKDGPRSQELFRRSLSINQNSDIALALAGWVEAANGNPAAGRELIERSRRLNPTPPTPWVALTGM